jgi:hypothetical protein
LAWVSFTAKAALNLAGKHAFAFKAQVHVVASLVGDAETSTFVAEPEIAG